LAAILNLCSKGMLLNQGNLITAGAVKDVCDSYIKMRQEAGTTERTTGIFRSLSLIDEDGTPTDTTSEGETLRFRCSIRVPSDRCLVSLIIRDSVNSPLCELFNRSFSLPRQDGSAVAVLIEAPNVPLRSGHYSVDCWCGDRFSTQSLELLPRAAEFEVIGSEKSETGTELLGRFWFPSKWRVDARSE